MTYVACFCGCYFSFDGGAAACPRCGEVASVRAGLALEDATRSQAKMPVVVLLAGRGSLPAHSRN